MKLRNKPTDGALSIREGALVFGPGSSSALRRTYFGAIMPRAFWSFTADLLDQQNAKFFRAQEPVRKFAQAFDPFEEFADHPSR